jgi:hypothetical protein
MITLLYEKNYQGHSHHKPNPHVLPSKIKNDITEAVLIDPSRTALQLQKGNNIYNGHPYISLFNN